MNSTLSLISQLDNQVSLDSHISKDYTYADQYPVFIDRQKLSNIVGKSSAVSRTVPPAYSSMRTQSKVKAQMPAIPDPPPPAKGKESVSGFHYSKYPSSSLDVGLEKQVILAEMYQNIEKIKVKERLFPPIKVVWNKTKAKPKKNNLRSSEMNMKALINGEICNVLCQDCGEKKCKCRILDNFCESTWNTIKHKYKDRSDIFEVTRRSRHIRDSSSQIRTTNSDYNYLADRIEQRRTRRRKGFSSNLGLMPEVALSISPKRIFVKVLDDGTNDDEDDY